VSSPSRDDIQAAFDSLNVESRSDERAPQKPLPVMLAQLSHGARRSIAFGDISPKLSWH